MQTSMQTIKTEFCGSGSYNGTPEKRAQQREKQLLTYVIKATARDQEKNIMISKLQREMSEAIQDFDALKTEVKLKEEMLHNKEDELQTVKAENEALKQQLQLLMTSNSKKAKVKYNDADDKNFLKPDSPDIHDGGSSSISPKPKISRKRSIKKQKDIGVAAATNLFYNLRKKTKK